MTSTHHPTTNTRINKPDEKITTQQHQQKWPSEILPTTLQSHAIQCQDQTPASARRLLSQGQLTPEDFIESSPDIERTLMEAFLEDDYEGKLHLTTLVSTIVANKNTTTRSDNDNDNNTSNNATATETTATTEAEGEVVGMAFWREVPSEEMNDWMDFQRISKAIIADRKQQLTGGTSKKVSSSSNDNDVHELLSHNARNAMQLVRSDSINWIQNALQPCSTTSTTDNEPPPLPTSTFSTTSTTTSLSTTTTTSIHTKLTHSWIKIELLAIKQSHRAHHLGTILLGCTLAKAHTSHHHHNEHAILHIASGGGGGGSSSGGNTSSRNNIPAAKLYQHYGFTSIPRYEEGGPFMKPDGDLYVLGNIGMVLDALPWEEMMMIMQPTKQTLLGGGEHDNDDEDTIGSNNGGDGGKRQKKLRHERYQCDI